MSDNDCIIRAARLAERQRRNNPWSEPAVTKRQQTDAEIIADAARERAVANKPYYHMTDWARRLPGHPASKNS